MNLRDVIAADLQKVFFSGSGAGFDQAVTIKPRLGAARTINAIIDRNYAEEYNVESYTLIMHCRTADIADCKQGDRVTIDGTAYTIKSPIQRDEIGVSICELTREVIGG